MDTTVLVALVGVGGVVAGAVVSGVVSLAIARRQSKAQDRTADAAVMAAEVAARAQIADGFAKLSAQYEARNSELMGELAATRGALAEANGKLDEALARADQLTGEVRDLTQHVESLESALREGRPIPARRRRAHPMAKPPLVALPGNDTTTGGGDA